MSVKRVVTCIRSTQGHRRCYCLSSSDILAGKSSTGRTTQGNCLGADILPVIIRRRTSHQHRTRHHRRIAPVVHLRGHRGTKHTQILRRDRSAQRRLCAERVVACVRSTQRHRGCHRLPRPHVLAGKGSSRSTIQGHSFRSDKLSITVRRRVPHQHRTRHHRRIAPVVDLRGHRSAKHAQIFRGDRSAQSFSGQGVVGCQI